MTCFTFLPLNIFLTDYDEKALIVKFSMSNISVLSENIFKVKKEDTEITLMIIPMSSQMIT